MKLIKFGNDHCPMCKAMDGMLEKLNVKVQYVDTDTIEGMALAQELGIRGLPVLVRLSNEGREEGRTGLTSIEELKKFVAK